MRFFQWSRSETANAQQVIHRSFKAQGIVEFAIVLPILLMLLLGIMEFGRLLFTYVAVVTAAREAARYGAASGASPGGMAFYQDCDGIRQAAIRIGSIAGIGNDDASVKIEYDFYDRSTHSFTSQNNGGLCPPTGTGPVLGLGDRIKVQVTATFRPTEGLINLPILSVQSTVRRTILNSIPVR